MNRLKFSREKLSKHPDVVGQSCRPGGRALAPLGLNHPLAHSFLRGDLHPQTSVCALIRTARKDEERALAPRAARRPMGLERAVTWDPDGPAGMAKSGTERMNLGANADPNGIY